MGKKKVGKFVVDLDQMLGKGNFAQVYKGINSQTKEEVAVKIISKVKIQQDQYTKRAFESQIRIMMKLKSQNIIRFLDVNQTKTNFYIMLQIANDGQLRQIIKNKKRLSQSQTVKYLIQILNAFEQMFKIGVIHRQNYIYERDIKPDNIFVKDGVLKIGDFGFAKNSSQLDNMMSTIVGSPAYMAPQILNQQRYSYKCDIWSVGIMAYQMLTGGLPFNLKSNNLKQIYKTIESSVIVFPEAIPITDEMKDFIVGCLKIKQEDRFDWFKVFLHPVFKGTFQKDFDGMKRGEQQMGYIMGSIRMIIHEHNINIKTQLGKLENQNLSYQEFTNFIKYLNCNISLQQVQTVFDVLRKNQRVYLGDFEVLLQKHGCKAKKLHIQGNASSQTQELALAKNLIRKANQQKQFDLYELLPKTAIETGEVLLKDFEVTLMKIAPQIPKKDIVQLFTNVFGVAQKKQLSLDKFCKVMAKICQVMPAKKKK